jgi:hypothetical protein
MPYATGAYTQFSTLPAPARSDLSSSRKIDFARKDYVLNDEGGFEPMNDITQRVVLLVSFAIKPRKFVTPRDLNGQKDDVRKALSILTSGSEPSIKLIDVTADAAGAGRTKTVVAFQNLLTNTKQTVTV